MATESIISATFGVPGSGKTYSRVRFLVEDFLINNLSGLYITNIPVNIPVVSEYVSDLLSKKGIETTAADISKRIIIIPDNVLIAWEKLNQLDNKELTVYDSSTFPPTQFLQQFNLSGAHIAVDEFHKYFSRKGPRLLRKLWNDWFAEIRKTGCVFEAITQSYGQMSDEFLDKCATRLELVNHSELRDPFFGIRMGDWYELRAGLLKRVPVQRITEKETMRGTSTSGAVVWKSTGRTKSYTLDPFYFKFYDSFRNYSGASGVRKSPSETYGRKVIFWFLRRNIVELFSRILIGSLVAWFLFFGGMKFAINSLFRVFGHLGTQNFSQIEQKKESVPPQKPLSDQPAIETENKALSSNNISPGKPQKKELPNEKKLKDEKVEVSKEIKSKDLDPFRPALFWDKICFLKCGLQITINYQFTGGILNGQKVTKIDSQNRFIQLDDGTILHMYVLGQ